MTAATLAHKVKLAAKTVLAPLLYKNPPINLQPYRLYLYMDTVYRSGKIPGSVVEIGCNICGTAVIVNGMMKNLGIDKPYVCYDTFEGFVDEQFRRDLSLGTPPNSRTMFTANSLKLAKKVLELHGATDVKLVRADIVALAAETLPNPIAVCLIDVDLSEPTYHGLRKVYPRLSKGGVILIDDCVEGSTWKARQGYQRFVREEQLPEDYRCGMGLVVKR